MKIARTHCFSAFGRFFNATYDTNTCGHCRPPDGPGATDRVRDRKVERNRKAVRNRKKIRNRKKFSVRRRQAD